MCTLKLQNPFLSRELLYICIGMNTNRLNENTFVEKAVAAAADPYRMSILREIQQKGFVRCCDVVSLTGLSQPTCSHHIKILLDSALIESRKEGRNNYFTINKNNFRKLSAFFDRFSAT